MFWAQFMDVGIIYIYEPKLIHDSEFMGFFIVCKEV